MAFTSLRTFKRGGGSYRQCQVPHHTRTPGAASLLRLAGADAGGSGALGGAVTPRGDGQPALQHN
eukprot:CAMPEP_0179962862 /NCGR_PEP_ID=MMETSP0983-20121128/30455_1 /TAXON_ID=483367 /ORGANISM="non described non described, Strain CCMP 2436" /LENGTH=64 /DNA_ID=CAMNT_0021875417 /DNA_START=169 /DNA_END=363 /DNA_ORIENTATION=+